MTTYKRITTGYARRWIRRNWWRVMAKTIPHCLLDRKSVV